MGKSAEMKSVYTEIYRKAKDCKGYEPVPGDFSMKTTGMDVFSRFIDLDGSNIALEIGCGSGFNAALLSSSCQRLVATDLPFYDARTHSLGIVVARELLTKLQIKNVDLVSCSGEVLPFPDNIFDFVYSTSVLEHIDNKEKALKEMMRVAKPGGTVIFIIPTYVQSICAFFHLYLYIVKRFIEVMRTKLFRPAAATRKGLLPKLNDSARSGGEISESFRKNHPSFPFPEPHGAYDNILIEFNEQLPWKWAKLAYKCGAASIDTFAVCFLPYNILEIFSTKLIAALYEMTAVLHKMFGRSFLQYFSYGWCVAVKK